MYNFNRCEKILNERGYYIDKEGNALDETNSPYQPRKVLRSGTLYIINGNKRYNIFGTEQKQEE